MGCVAKKRLTEKQLREIEKRISEGATRQSVAFWLGWSVPTFYRMIEKDERLKAALEVGKANDYQTMMNTAREQALKGSYQHLAGYMRVIHGVSLTDGATNGASGVSIVVNINMQSDESGEIIDHNIERVERTKQISNEFKDLE